MACLDRDSFLTAKVVGEKRRVDLPEFGDGAYLHVRTLTSGEMNRFRMSLIRRKKGGIQTTDLSDSNEKFMILACCDDADKPIFTEADIPKLRSFPSVLIERIVGAGKDLNGMNDPDDEDGEKNGDGSRRTLDADSNSDSPAPPPVLVGN